MQKCKNDEPTRNEQRAIRRVGRERRHLFLLNSSPFPENCHCHWIRIVNDRAR